MMEASYEGMKVGHGSITFDLETQITMMDLRGRLARKLAIKPMHYICFCICLIVQ